jgi:hypothetical protein
MKQLGLAGKGMSPLSVGIPQAITATTGKN